MQGWIKLHRRIQECFLWIDKEPFDRRSAWIDLLLSANHEDKKLMFDGKPIIVNRGDKLTSILALADRWHWSRHKVSNFLNVLENEQMIIQKRDNKKTLITIVNYEVYQAVAEVEGQQKDIKRTTEGHQKDINKNVKNVKNVKNDSKKESSKRICDLYHELCPSLPKVMKLTDARIKVINARLKEYSEEDIKAAFKKAEQSPFLRGDKKDWKASFDWIMKSGNMAKILEGNYDDTEKKKDKGYKKQQYDFEALQKMI